MNRFFTLLLAAFCLTAVGQVAVTEAELPQADSSYLFVGFEADSSLFEAGHGITWGLVNVSSTDTFGIDVQPISEAPFISQFVFNGFDPYTQADHFYPYSYRSASIDLAESQSGQGFGNIRGYFQVLENGYNQVGFEIDFEGLALPIAFDDVIEKYELPLQPEQEWESTSSYSLGLPEHIELYVTQTGGSMVDGSGQIVLPDGSQREVYRIKSSHAVRDSLIVYESADTIVEEYERLQYSWIGTGGFPWVQITLENGVVVESWWQKGFFDGEVMGCTDFDACNYNPVAEVDDEFCLYLDALGECGGPCEADDDVDGICDDIDDCVGEFDACGICDGPGAIYECGCTDIPLGNCDCNGNVIDALGVCGGLCTVDNDNNGVCDDQEIYGCTYSQAENYLPEATRDDGSCLLGEGCNPVCDLEYDGNGDGSVGSGDLLGLLTEFGAECTPETAFTCGNPVSYQGYDYETVQIGEQCWFAENLRAENYRNGDAIPYGLDADAWATTMEGARAIFDNDPSWLGSYGQLYNLHAVMDVRGICPAGWHVPDAIEFDPLAQTLGGYDVAGEALKSSAQDTPSWNGTNTSGFNGLPAGYRDMFGEFDMLGVVLQMWTNTPYSCGGRNKKL